MDSTAAKGRLIRFGAFEVVLAAGELRKNGVRLKLQEQPFQVLAALLEKPGELVSRAELKERLWSSDTFVDFDRGLNTAVNKIRETLGDSAHNPRFVETISKRGYRFVAPLVQPDLEANAALSPNLKVPAGGRRLAVATGLLALAAGAVILGWSHWERTAVEPNAGEPIPLTAYPGVEKSPTFSPDGRQIAFAWQKSAGADFNIWVQDVGQQNPRQLTTDPAHDHSPAWSPDGRLIAFLRYRQEDAADVLTIPPHGGPESRVGAIVSSAESPARLSWSPDGTLLAVDERVGETGPVGLSTVAIPGGEKRQIVRDKYVRAPAFSPDGSSIAFFTNTKHDADLAVVGLADGNLRTVAKMQGFAGGLIWTKDSSRLVAAVSGRPWIIPVAGGQSRVLGSFGDGFLDPALSLSTGRLAFLRRVKRASIFRFSTQDAEAQPQPFAPSTYGEVGPQFSSDGQKVVFTSRRTGEGAIWVADADGSNTVRLTRKQPGGTPRWSPDGSWIVFDAPADGSLKTHVMRSSGGPRRRVTLGAGFDGVASFSRDGLWIYFGSERSGELQVWKVPLEGESETTPAVQVTRRGGFAAFESHDGRYVYYTKTRGRAEPTYANSIWRVPVDGGEEEPVIENVYSSWGNWALSRDAVFYINYEPGDVSNGALGRQWAVYRYDLERRKNRKILNVPGEPPLASAGFDVSDDGRWILYAAVTEEADLFLVEDFR